MELFTCPNCVADLQLGDGALFCASGHSFDLAQSGYVNLLPAHQRKSRNPGDDVQMVKARRRFLDRGFFSPLRVQLCREISERIGSRQVESPGTTLVDLGCGEGYFTDALTSVASSVYGIDVSKPAIQAAAKRYKSLHLAVASNVRLPLRYESFDVVTTILSPFRQSVFKNLSAGGFLVRITPGRHHLQELKELIYREPRQHRRASKEIAGSRHLQEREVTFDMTLDPASLMDLISMTPMLYRAKRDQIARIDSVGQLLVSASFWIDIFTKQ